MINPTEYPEWLAVARASRAANRKRKLLRDTPCQHRGESLRTVNLDTCPCSNGMPRPVYRCAIYGECMLTRLLKGMRACDRCGQHTALSDGN